MAMIFCEKNQIPKKEFPALLTFCILQPFLAICSAISIIPPMILILYKICKENVASSRCDG